MRAHTVGAGFVRCLRHLQSLTIVADRCLVGLPQLFVFALQTTAQSSCAVGAVLLTQVVGAQQPSPAESEATPLPFALYPAT